MTTDDEISISTLRAVAQAHLGSAAGELPNTPELRTVLGKEFGRPGHAAASEGDLARAALDLLRQDPAFAEPIQLMSSQAGEPASRQRYLEPLTIALTTAALLALQTGVKFKRDHTGKWSLELEKKSSSDSTLKLLVQHLLPFLGK